MTVAAAGSVAAIEANAAATMRWPSPRFVCDCRTARGPSSQWPGSSPTMIAVSVTEPMSEPSCHAPWQCADVAPAPSRTRYAVRANRPGPNARACNSETWVRSQHAIGRISISLSVISGAAHFTNVHGTRCRSELRRAAGERHQPYHQASCPLPQSAARRSPCWAAAPPAVPMYAPRRTPRDPMETP